MTLNAEYIGQTMHGKEEKNEIVVWKKSQGGCFVMIFSPAKKYTRISVGDDVH